MDNSRCFVGSALCNCPASALCQDSYFFCSLRRDNLVGIPVSLGNQAAFCPKTVLGCIGNNHLFCHSYPTIPSAVGFRARKGKNHVRCKQRIPEQRYGRLRLSYMECSEGGAVSCWNRDLPSCGKQRPRSRND